MIWRSAVALASNSNSCLRHRDWQRKKEKGKEKWLRVTRWFCFSENARLWKVFPIIMDFLSYQQHQWVCDRQGWQWPWFGGKGQKHCQSASIIVVVVLAILSKMWWKIKSTNYCQFFSFSTHFWQGICLLVLLEIFEQSKVGSHLLNKLAV